MTFIYALIFAFSLLLFPCYFLLVRKKQREPWLFSLILCICTVCLGYLLLSLSRTVNAALLANKLAYLGQAFLLACIFLLIFKLCGFAAKRPLIITLLGVATLMFAMVMTTGHLDWYYKSATVASENGATYLIKEYGVLHPLYLCYVLFYFIAMLTVIALALRKKASKTSKIAGLMLAVVFGNIGMWLVEKLVTLHFEFLSVSYLMSGFIFCFVYWLLPDYTHAEKADDRENEQLTRVLTRLAKGETLSTRENEILILVIKGKKRRDIATELHLSENTVKTYTRSLYTKIGVTSRDELYTWLEQ